MSRTQSVSWLVLPACVLLVVGLLLPSLAMAGPRDDLATQGLDFTADVFVERAGAGDLEAVKLFLAAGMDVNARECCLIPLDDSRRWGTSELRRVQQWRAKTALVNAAKHGHLDVVEYLLNQGTDPLLQNNNEESALYLAAGMGHLEIVQLLIKSGADVSASSTYGTSPLMAAASGGYVEVAALLLEGGADIDYAASGPSTVANVGNTALIYAAMYQQTEMVRFLIARGADVNKRIGSTGETALDRAANSPEIVSMLRAAGGKSGSRQH